MNTWDKCKNCGGEYGLHHFETNQCPVGGREAPFGQKQEWKRTTFELDDTEARDKLASLREANAELVKALESLLADVEYAQTKIEGGLIGNRQIHIARAAIAKHKG